MSKRKLIQIGLTAAAFALIFAITTFSVHAEEKIVGIGYQKDGALGLLKTKGLLEEQPQPLGFWGGTTE